MKRAWLRWTLMTLFVVALGLTFVQLGQWQLDRLDQESLLDLLGKADACTIQRDFRCTEKRIASAARLATGTADRKAIADARQRLDDEKRLQRREQEEEARLRREEERAAARATQLAELREECAALCSDRQEYSRCAAGHMSPRSCSEPSGTGGGGGGVDPVGLALVQGLQQMQRNVAVANQANNLRMAQIQEQLAEQRREEQARQARERRHREEQSRRENEQARQQRQQELQAERQRRMQELEAAQAQRVAQAEQRERDQERQHRSQLRAQEATDRQQAVRNYLNELRGSIRLAARTCYGELHVGGSRPPRSPNEPVTCIDVDFRAQCSGSATDYADGTLTTFVGGGAGCYGDTRRIPKLACSDDDIRVTVRDVRQCR